MIRLNLGSGPHPLPEHVNIDLYAPADVKDNAATLRGYQPGAVDEIRAEHVLEHMGWRDGQRAVNRWYQLLAKGGRLYVTVPDVAMSIRAWLEAYDNGGNVWGFRSQAIWGDQAHEGEYHRWGYDADSLLRALTSAGFHDIVITRKPGHDPMYPGNKRPDWWIVAEAVK